jgi:hypothetical protein
VRSGLLGALVYREVLAIRTKRAKRVALTTQVTGGCEGVYEGSARMEAEALRRAGGLASDVRRDALMMMCANSEEIMSYVARVPEFRAVDEGSSEGRAGVCVFVCVCVCVCVYL